MNRRLVCWGQLYLFFLIILAGRLSAQADQVRYISTGEEALMEMAQIIKGAQRSIDLTYYILDPCATSTKVLIKQMAERVRAGVRVRIVVDGYTHDFDLRRRYTNQLARLGIEIRYYNVRAEFNPAINYRTHSKIMLVDGKEYISGGRNIAQDYFSISPHLNFLDRDVHVKGVSAKTAQADFDNFWNSPLTLAEKSPPDWIADKLKSCLAWGKAEKTLADIIAKHAARVVASRPTISCSHVNFYMDDYNFNKAGLSDDGKQGQGLRRKHTTRELIQLVKNTKSILTLENWSYDPWASLRKAINDLRQKKIPVYVITNKVTDVGGAMDYINSISVDKDNWGTQAIIELSSQGSFQDRWDMSPPSAHWMIHSKVYISDDVTTAVTSANMDARSYHTNLETAVIVKNCPAFAEQALKSFAVLNGMWDKDQSCKKCYEEPTFKFSEKLKGILGRSFY